MGFQKIKANYPWQTDIDEHVGIGYHVPLVRGRITPINMNLRPEHFESLPCSISDPVECYLKQSSLIESYLREKLEKVDGVALKARTKNQDWIEAQRTMLLLAMTLADQDLAMDLITHNLGRIAQETWNEFALDLFAVSEAVLPINDFGLLARQIPISISMPDSNLLKNAHFAFWVGTPLVPEPISPLLDFYYAYGSKIYWMGKEISCTDCRFSFEGSKELRLSSSHYGSERNVLKICALGDVRDESDTIYQIIPPYDIDATYKLMNNEE